MHVSASGHEELNQQCAPTKRRVVQGVMRRRVSSHQVVITCRLWFGAAAQAPPHLLLGAEQKRSAQAHAGWSVHRLDGSHQLMARHCPYILGRPAIQQRHHLNEGLETGTELRTLRTYRRQLCGVLHNRRLPKHTHRGP
jgi:hypothetical protein